MGDKTKGWLKKYHVNRVDGSDTEGGKHHECAAGGMLFVLDIMHDPLAQTPALEYAYSAHLAGYGPLAADIVRRVKASPHWHPESLSKRLEFWVAQIEACDARPSSG